MIIYKITNKINDKSYIGQSQCSLERRWCLHKSDTKNNRDNTYFHNAIRKYGTECWELEILEEIEDINFLNEAEMNWIEHYDSIKNGYNSTNGGENGRVVSEETKGKIRQSRLGKKMSQETKEKLRQANLGRPGYFKGIKLSKEHCQHLSESHLGSIPWNKGKNGIQIAWNKNKPHSEEHKQHLKDAWIKRKQKDLINK